jgi:pyruvate formate lyase activating enzyme
MADLQPIEIGSRHDLRAARSPGAPDTNGYEGRGATFGWVHSYETGSTVDGPGVRITLFMSGCLLRCQYCHNPDTWHLKDGTKVELAQAVRRLGDFAPMLRAMGGGLTISGGEPLVQIGFTGGMLAAAKRMGLHTAIETSGFLGARADDAYLANLDMVGAFKWKSLGLDYPLDDMAPPSETQVKMAVDIFRQAGCRVR